MGKAENSVEGHLVKEVERRGGVCLKFSAAFVIGVPDRIVILGETVFVETKAPLGKPSKIQKVRHAQMRAAGARVEVLHTRALVDAFVRDLHGS